MEGPNGKALTATELVIADLSRRGKRDDEIAAELGLRRSTVALHLRRIERKLGGSRR
jgi:DNA-binding CsgD family transcriptional regulator